MKYILCGINAKYIHSNLAIFSLKAYADRHCTRAAQISLKEYTINHYSRDIIADLYKEKADVLVFSCYIWNISMVEEIAGELKKVQPGLKIWLGGPEVSYHSSEYLRDHAFAELIMQGEGEETFARLVNMHSSEGYEPMPMGVTYRMGERILYSGFPKLMDMDELPFPYSGFELFDHKIIYYETSRGCPYQCSYCLSSVDKTVRFRSEALVREDLDRFLAAKVPQVKFVDRTFNCRKKHAMFIWNYIQDHDNGVTNFHFEIAADLLDEDALDLFAKMRPGLIQLEIGVQSTCPETLMAIRRQPDTENIFRRTDQVRALGNIHQHLDLIAGLPYEDLSRFAQSFDDLYAHRPNQLQLGFLKVLKGTTMEAETKKWRLIYTDKEPYEVLSTRWLSYDDILILKGVEEMVEMFYNSGQFSYTLEYLMQDVVSPFEFYYAFSDWYQKKDYHKCNHNRMEKYEILKAFVEESRMVTEDRIFQEIMLLDMYLREPLKKRPEWIQEVKGRDDMSGEKIAKGYRRFGEQIFPEEYRDAELAAGKAAGRMHFERFDIDVDHLMKIGQIRQAEILCVFDYTERDALNGNAKVRSIPVDRITTESN